MGFSHPFGTHEGRKQKTGEIIERYNNIVMDIILGIISILSIIFNIFLYKEKRKFDIFKIEKDIKLKEIELDELQQKHRKEYNTALFKHKRENNNLRADILTSDDKERLQNLWERQKREEDKAWVEYAYLSDLKGDRSSFALTPNKNFLLKIKDKLFIKIKK